MMGKMMNDSSRMSTSRYRESSAMGMNSGRFSAGSSVWNDEHNDARGDFTLAGSVKLAKHIEEQVKANGRAEQRKGSRVRMSVLWYVSVTFGVSNLLFLLR